MLSAGCRTPFSFASANMSTWHTSCHELYDNHPFLNWLYGQNSSILILLPHQSFMMVYVWWNQLTVTQSITQFQSGLLNLTVFKQAQIQGCWIQHNLAVKHATIFLFSKINRQRVCASICTQNLVLSDSSIESDDLKLNRKLVRLQS